MVLDEELKMMAVVAEHGGQVVGPYLKQMSQLTHTEYLLAGRGSLDVREVLRRDHVRADRDRQPDRERLPGDRPARAARRGYYAGVLALLGHDDAGRQTLDAPILIRTAEIYRAGRLRVPVGATLVRHSTAAGEVAETHAKAAGVLAAWACGPDRRGRRPQPAGAAVLAADPGDIRGRALGRPERHAGPVLAGRAAPGAVRSAPSWPDGGC